MPPTTLVQSADAQGAAALMAELAETHRVENQPPPLHNTNLYTQDHALVEGVARHGAAWAHEGLQQWGAWCGSAEAVALGFAANEHKPQLYTHDAYGHRVDEVRFHPAYHTLMRSSLQQGLHAAHWRSPRPGAQVARAAELYLQSQVDAAHICPITMTAAAVAALREQPELANQWLARILTLDYDPRNIPMEQKAAITVGMAMTEKQGGSDVRANSLRALPLGGGGPGQEYALVGHKYFVSAPMSDAFLVLAQAPGGLSCFWLPRWCADGRKNAMHIQRLKNKMGNVANASAETELRGAWAQMVGPEGRGVATILKMVTLTRFDCMIGSSSGMRHAVAQATHHARYRRAFGQRLCDQPLMRNVLADLILEHEAALALTLRIGQALDGAADDAAEHWLARLGTAIGKYWICKRTPAHAAEAMECIGGSGVMEDCIMPRLFRESPVNSIWEGSGNVQCLDMLRALQRAPEAQEALMAEVQRGSGIDGRLDHAITQLQRELRDPESLEYRARRIVEKMALTLQGSLLVRHAPRAVADAFCAARLGGDTSGLAFGALPRGVDCQALIERATPEGGSGSA